MPPRKKASNKGSRAGAADRGEILLTPLAKRGDEGLPGSHNSKSTLRPASTLTSPPNPRKCYPTNPPAPSMRTTRSSQSREPIADHKVPIDCPFPRCEAKVEHQHPPALQFYKPRPEFAMNYLGYANATSSVRTSDGETEDEVPESGLEPGPHRGQGNSQGPDAEEDVHLSTPPYDEIEDGNEDLVDEELADEQSRIMAENAAALHDAALVQETEPPNLSQILCGTNTIEPSACTEKTHASHPIKSPDRQYPSILTHQQNPQTPPGQVDCGIPKPPGAAKRVRDVSMRGESPTPRRRLVSGNGRFGQVLREQVESECSNAITTTLQTSIKDTTEEQQPSPENDDNGNDFLFNEAPLTNSDKPAAPLPHDHDLNPSSDPLFLSSIDDSLTNEIQELIQYGETMFKEAADQSD